MRQFSRGRAVGECLLTTHIITLFGSRVKSGFPHIVASKRSANEMITLHALRVLKAVGRM